MSWDKLDEKQWKKNKNVICVYDSNGEKFQMKIAARLEPPPKWCKFVLEHTIENK